MGVIRETLNLLGLNVLFDFIRDIIERVKYIFIPPRAFSWQTLIYLSIFSWLMSSLANPGSPIQDIIAFFGWMFLVGGTSWYTTDKPLYIPGTIMPIGAVITGGIVSLFAFGVLCAFCLDLIAAQRLHTACKRAAVATTCAGRLFSWGFKFSKTPENKESNLLQSREILGRK